MRLSFLVILSLGLVPAAALAAQAFAGWMRRVALGIHIREYGPNLHEKKSGTPTMGGVVILVLWGLAVALSLLFGAVPARAAFVVVAGLAFGAVGLLDDLISLGLRRSLGLRPWQNLLLTSAVAIALYVGFSGLLRGPLRVPFSTLTLSLSFLPGLLVAWLVFLSATDTMNLTDGLDGLASGATLLILAGFLLVAPGTGLAPALLPLGAILVGFLWVNGHPAKLFLGNVGSFSLGGVVGACALTTGTAFLLPILAGLLVLEGGSVLVQVTSFRLTGRRVFKIAPLHHHFEHAEGIDYPHLLPGVEWPEPKVTLRLWIVQAAFVALAFLAARP